MRWMTAGVVAVSVMATAQLPDRSPVRFGLWQRDSDTGGAQHETYRMCVTQENWKQWMLAVAASNRCVASHEAMRGSTYSADESCAAFTASHLLIEVKSDHEVEGALTLRIAGSPAVVVTTLHAKYLGADCSSLLPAR